MNTLNNPGSYAPIQFKSNRIIASSFLAKLKSKEFYGAMLFLRAEILNKLNRDNILNKNGKYFCPLCKNNSGSFVRIGNKKNAVCPHCTSRARHRGLIYLYQNEILGLDSNSKVLHFAPEPVFYQILKNKIFTYHTTDFFLEDVDLPKQDIQNLSIADAQYDLVLSNHVIEHVPDDEKALAEMSRVTKNGGKVIITVPGNYTRLKTIYFNNLKNQGHYRDYGMDFMDKMKKAFTEVLVIDLYTFDTKGELAIPENELAFIGIK
jgi:SAM-dependent methyltransferase